MSDPLSPDYGALLQTWHRELSEQLDHGPGATFFMMPLGALRRLVGERFLLDNLREEISDVVLDPDLKDTEVVVITADSVAVAVFQFEEERDGD